MELTFPLDDRSPGGQYLALMAQQMSEQLFDGNITVTTLNLILTTMCTQVGIDIAEGRIATLPGIGEFTRVDNHGAMVRYQAPQHLMERCQEELDGLLHMPFEMVETETPSEQPPTNEGDLACGQPPIEEWNLVDDHRFNRSKR